MFCRIQSIMTKTSVPEVDEQMSLYSLLQKRKVGEHVCMFECPGFLWFMCILYYIIYYIQMGWVWVWMNEWHSLNDWRGDHWLLSKGFLSPGHWSIFDCLGWLAYYIFLVITDIHIHDVFVYAIFRRFLSQQSQPSWTNAFMVTELW